MTYSGRSIAKLFRIGNGDKERRKTPTNTTGDGFDRLVDFRTVSSRIYRVGSAAWKRDRVPTHVHLGIPGAKSALCGLPRRFLENTATDFIEPTDRDFGGRLPLCAYCQSIASGEQIDINGPPIIQYRMGWRRRH